MTTKVPLWAPFRSESIENPGEISWFVCLGDDEDHDTWFTTEAQAQACADSLNTPYDPPEPFNRVDEQWCDYYGKADHGGWVSMLQYWPMLGDKASTRLAGTYLTVVARRGAERFVLVQDDWRPYGRPQAALRAGKELLNAWCLETAENGEYP